MLFLGGGSLITSVHHIFSSMSVLYPHFTERNQCTHLVSTNIRDHTALHDYHAFLTLLSVSERTVSTADHVFCKLCPQTVLPSIVFRRDASLRSCFQMAGLALLHTSCTLMLLHSAVAMTFSAHLQFLIPSRQPYMYSFAESIWIWAGHILVDTHSEHRLRVGRTNKYAGPFSLSEQHLSCSRTSQKRKRKVHNVTDLNLQVEVLHCLCKDVEVKCTVL